MAKRSAPRNSSTLDEREKRLKAQLEKIAIRKQIKELKGKLKK